MKFMLDTDVCVDAIRLRTPEMLARIKSHAVGEIVVSSITLAELVFGAAKSLRPAQNHAALQAFVGPLEIAPFDAPAAASYGGLRAALARRGASIGPFDTLIAGHALSLGATLVTYNVREFSRVPALRLADWSRS
jgi:tRNA(fMet)-specific endonuclease VapC